MRAHIIFNRQLFDIKQMHENDIEHTGSFFRHKNFTLINYFKINLLIEYEVCSKKVHFFLFCVWFPICSVNSAFISLRDLIPTEPKTRKLSKIETLRLAKSYIEHLAAMLITGNLKIEINYFKNWKFFSVL